MMVEQVQMMLDEKSELTARRASEEAEYERVQHQVVNYYQDFHIEAHKHIFANVELHIGQAFNRTQREHGTCMVFNQGKELKFDYETKH